MSPAKMQPIVVYMINHHPLELSGAGPVFQWLDFDNNFKQQLKEWVGPYDPEQLSFLMDEKPSGEAWTRLIDGLVDGQIKSVVTHLAPLSSAHRHLLIGTCAQVGAQLITPSDAGRNKEDDT